MKILKQYVRAILLTLLVFAGGDIANLAASLPQQNAEDREPKAKRPRKIPIGQENPTEATHESIPVASALTETTTPSAFSQAQHIFTCSQGRPGRQYRTAAAHVNTPSYAVELSRWVQERRLARLSRDIDLEALKESLKERFDYQDIRLSVTSNRVARVGNYTIAVNHISLDTKGAYRSGFDILLIKTPQELWIEGEMIAPHIRFEDGLHIRDVWGLTFSFTPLINKVFPAGLLEKYFAGETLSKEEKTPEIQDLVEFLEGDKLREHILDQIEFIPFVA